MRKSRTLAAALSMLALSAAFALPDDGGAVEEPAKKSPWNFSLSVDFGYYPKSDHVVSDSSHFAPATGAFKKVEGRVVGRATYTLPIPFGDNFLVRGNTITFENSLELSPISIKPELCVMFTPVAFFKIGIGAEAGTGWDMLGFHGMQAWDSDEREYKSKTPFASWYWQVYAQAALGADTGVLFPGDWTHVIVGLVFKLKYEALANGGEGRTLWLWQHSGGNVDGLQYHAVAVVAYQMPIALRRVGVMFDFEGHFKSSDYETGSAYNGDFMQIEISPMAQLKFGKHDSLAVMLGFKSRRAFKEKSDDSDEEPFLTYSSREWFFNRIALSWTHDF